MILTFVFSVYLTDTVGDDLPGGVSANSWLGYSIGTAGLLIALLAPVIGQRADASGRRKLVTGVWTALTIAAMAGALRRPRRSRYLWLGLVLLGLGSIFFELASVSYNAMLRQVSTPATIGRVSGFGWAMGYFGGIVLLLVVYFGFVAGDGGRLFGVPRDDGFNIRLVALVAAAWFLVFALPLFLAVPEMPPLEPRIRPPRGRRLLPRAGRGPVRAVPGGPAHGVLPRRQRAVPRRSRRDLHLRRGARGHRLRHRRGPTSCCSAWPPTSSPPWARSPAAGSRTGSARSR